MTTVNFADQQPRPPRSIHGAAMLQYNLRFACRRCDHIRIFDSHALWWLFHCRHWSDALPDVPRRLWCTCCFMAERLKVRRPLWTTTRDEPTGELLPLPDEREWKRLVRRYRS